MTINDSIRLRREAKGLSQKELGQMCGVSGVMVGYYERGLRQPTLPIAMALADALGCTLDELTGRTATA